VSLLRSLHLWFSAVADLSSKGRNAGCEGNEVERLVLSNVLVPSRDRLSLSQVHDSIEWETFVSIAPASEWRLNCRIFRLGPREFHLVMANETGEKRAQAGLCDTKNVWQIQLNARFDTAAHDSRRK